MTTEKFWLLVVLGAPLLTALLLLALRGRFGRVSGWVACVGAGLPLVGAFALLPALQRGAVPALHFAWIPAAHIELGLHLDWLAFPFMLTEAAVTLLAILYAQGYHRVDSRTPYFYALLLIFSMGMAGTTLADTLFLFYTFWELMLVASCILILVWGDGEQRGAIALKYFIFTHVGSLLVLVSFILLFQAAGSDRFSALQQVGSGLAPELMRTLIALFLVGFCVKMAIFPLHLWLPDAHTVAPMPVTIMLAAAMLSMGTYGILRFPLTIFPPEAVAYFSVPMMVGGIVSEIYGALMALAEDDVKRIVAYSSVSQMGYVLFGLGTMTHNGLIGATLHVVYHAIVKALLFMVIGLVIRATGKRSISELGGLGEALPLVAVCAGIGVLAIAGAPPLCIFDSEWMIFAGGFDTEHMALAVLAVLGSLLTVAYALWFMARIFFGKRPEGLPVKELPWAMVVPTVLLAVLALVEGLFPAPLFAWVSEELTLILGGGLR